VNCYLAVLTILNLSGDDAGEYMFVARNSKGIHDGTIQLNITEASFSISSMTSSSSSKVSSAAIVVPEFSLKILLLALYTIRLYGVHQR